MIVSVVVFSIFSISIVILFIIKLFVSKFLHRLWYGFLSYRYPDLEFINSYTIRSLLDTTKNQGVEAVLLCIKGGAQTESVRTHLQELVNRKCKNGKLQFPRLRQALVTKCGTYAWQKVNFNLDKNFTVAPGTFKQRPVTEANIQDYVNDLMTKYLPPNTSPWHLIIIPTLENQHYILLKLHHLLLQENLNIGDILPLIPPTKHVTGVYTAKSPLVRVFEKPNNITALRERLTQDLSNRWNEFLSNNDPLENVELQKTSPGFIQFLAITLITIIAVAKEIRRGYKYMKTDFSSRYQFVRYTIEREATKRRISFWTFFVSIVVTLNPINLLIVTLVTVYKLIMFCTIKWVSALSREIFALFQCLTQGYCGYSGTLIGTVYCYVPLVFGSLLESLQILKIVLNAPKYVLSDIFFQKKYLQTVTLSGRKCVCWSEPIKSEQLKTIAKAYGVTEFEILLTALSVNLSKYLIQTGSAPTDRIPTILRNVNSNYVFATGCGVRPDTACGGIVFVGLPLPQFGDTTIENLIKVEATLKESFERQQVSYCLSLLQTRYGFLMKILPSFFLSIYLRYLSGKFPISVTEITSRYPNVVEKALWGQEVQSAIYWKPPQANTCISLCLNEYSDHVRLGVICDARLLPNHTILAKNFNNHIEDLAKNVGV